jgi:hypothetical protein
MFFFQPSQPGREGIFGWLPISARVFLEKPTSQRLHGSRMVTQDLSKQLMVLLWGG